MKIVWILLIVVAIILLLTLLITYICFLMAFHSSGKKDTDEFSIPPGKIYEPFRELMVSWRKELKKLPSQDFSIQSFDGLTLRGTYYEFAPGAPIELMFHGYRGDGERDLSGGIQRCFSLGRSTLLVNQRSCGNSDGNIITFGINEKKDCLAWIDFMIKHFGTDVKIILTGVSMGASTVMLAAGEELPENVIGVLADCGFTSAKDIIKKVIRQMHLPPNLLYPFVKLAAKIFGQFNLEEDSPIEALKRCQIPVIFFHGEDDDFVPCDMSRINYEACVTRKKLVTIPGAGHGLSYMVDKEKYLTELRNFFK